MSKRLEIATKIACAIASSGASWKAVELVKVSVALANDLIAKSKEADDIAEKEHAKIKEADDIAEKERAKIVAFIDWPEYSEVTVDGVHVGNIEIYWATSHVNYFFRDKNDERSEKFNSLSDCKEYLTETLS